MGSKKPFYGISLLAAAIVMLDKPLVVDSSGHIRLAESVTLPAINKAIADYTGLQSGADFDIMAGAHDIAVQAYGKDADDALRKFVSDTVDEIELGDNSVFATRGTVRQAMIHKAGFDTAILMAAKHVGFEDVENPKVEHDPDRWQMLMRSFHPAPGEVKNLRIAA